MIIILANKIMEYYFYKHSLTYQYVLKELNNKILTIYNQNTSNYPEFVNNTYETHCSHDICDSYPEFVNNTYESEKLYGDYDEWEDYIDSIY
jgi:hypothetical protein